MANQEPNVQFPGYGPVDEEQSTVEGSPFELATIHHFLNAALSGDMPGGVKTTLPLFPKEYMSHFNRKYTDWAPEPFNKLPPPSMGILGRMPGDSPGPITRVMYVMSGMDKMFDIALHRQVNYLPPSFKSMKSKIWLGMAPISDARWRAKGLDDETNIEEAIASIQQVVDVFQYQLRPEIQGEMRTIHNKVWTEIDVFNDAIIALRSQSSEPIPDFNLARLWQEYIQLQILFTFWKDRMIRGMAAVRPVNETQVVIRVNHWVLLVLNKLLDLYVKAEIFIRTRIDGFALLEGIDQRLIGAITLEKTEEELNQIYARIENQRVFGLTQLLGSVLAARTAMRHASPQGFPDFLESSCLIIDREATQRELMRQMNNPLPLVVESWVQDVSHDRVEKFGFVIYRNTYSQSDEDWKIFLSKFESGLSSGWEGVLDPANARRKAMLHWIDGKEENIPEDDIDAIRKHFKAFSESHAFPSGLTKSDCLVINKKSFQSFSKSRSTDQNGDYRGFLVVIDANPKLERRSVREGQLTGYAGSFNIIDQLVWTDLFAMKTNRCCQLAEEYWTLAAQHPWAVYVGPTTGVRRRRWREMKEGLEGLALLVASGSAGRD